jgi:hypothetical protein
MNNLNINLFYIIACLLLTILFYGICFHFFWVRVNVGLSLADANKILLGISVFSFHLSISTMALYYSIMRDGMSLRVTYWFYSFVFLGVAPLMQGGFGIWRHGFNLSILINLSLILLFAHLFFTMGYTQSSRKWRRRMALRNIKIKDQSIHLPQYFFLDGNKALLFSIIAFIFSIITTLIYGFHFTSSIIREIFGFTYSPLESIAEYFIRPCIFFAFSYVLYTVVNGDRRFIYNLSLFLLSCSVFLIIGPLSGARSIIFFLYFGLFIILFRHKMLKYPRLFGGLLFLGIFGSELQNLIRAYIYNGSNFALAGVNYFFQGHFDGFEMIGHTIDYVNSQGMVLGSQFLSAFLFWVPRSFWPGKSIGSGDFITFEHLAKTEVITFANFSMPLVGEAYINFGMLGVCTMMFLVGWFCGKEDGRFHTVRKFETIMAIKQPFEPLWMWRYGSLLGIFLFVLRGDLQSGLSFAFGIVLALTFTWLFLHGRKHLI